jgi:hypothetical protein
VDCGPATGVVETAFFLAGVTFVVDPHPDSATATIATAAIAVRLESRIVFDLLDMSIPLTLSAFILSGGTRHDSLLCCPPLATPRCFNLYAVFLYEH